MRTLYLTSPLMHNPDVKIAQTKLNGNNVFKKDWLQGPVDGIYGEATARGAKRAKYWIGYPQTQIRGYYGEDLDKYLSGDKKPTAIMRERRKRRLATAAQQPVMRLKAFNALAAHAGQTENPAGSNRFPWATDWYGFRGPWCAMAVSHAYVEAGSKSFRAGYHYSYVPNILMDARRGDNHLAVTSTPLKGDLVLFDWDNDWNPDHVGLFDEWISKGSHFKTCEGNTSADSGGSQSNGGGVYRRERYTSDVRAFVHVGSGS